MDDQLWKEGYGIKFEGKVKSHHDVVGSDTPDAAPPADAIPTTNGFWDSQLGYDIDKVAVHGFTTAELIDLGALAAHQQEKNVLPNNLTGAPHPAFAIDKWETSVPAHFKRKHTFPLGNDLSGKRWPGHYTANNLVVWDALLPCLRLASKFVENAHIFPWYGAFLHSDIHEISHTTADAKQLLIPLRNVHFQPQSDVTSPTAEKATRERIAAISKNLRLGISDGKADPTGTSSDLNIQYDGVAIPPWEDNGTTYRIYLAYQIIEPLINNGLGPSTKLALQFHVALTLLHEFAHVLAFAKVGSRNAKLYLENERISEAGFSFETTTFGARPVLLLQHIDTPEYGNGLRAGFLLEDWLGTPKLRHSTAPLSGTDADWSGAEWREARSIPISFLEELGQEDFWRSFVGKWCAEALNVYPWTEGRLVRKRGNALDTQVYSLPKHQPAWLAEVLQISHKELAPLTPDELIAVKIANRRISREHDISKLVKTRRRLNEQKLQEQHEKTPPAVVSQQDNTPAAVTAGPEKENPWEMRARHIKAQKAQLKTQLMLFLKDEQRVQNFLKRKDIGTSYYLEIQKNLMDSNELDCDSLKGWVQTALDDELLSGYEQLLKRYEDMKGLLGRVSRESSKDPETEEKRITALHGCVVLLRRAQASRGNGKHELCSDYCKDILSNGDAAQHQHAGACLLLGLSMEDKELKVWYLKEAVRIFTLIEHFEGKEPTDITKNKRRHAEKRLKEAETELDAAKAATTTTKSPPISPDVITTITSITSTIPKSPKPTPRKPFTGWGNPPSSPPTPVRDPDPPPPGMAPVDIIRHQRTFRVINQARRNFLQQKYGIAERAYLELLTLDSTPEREKAQCNAFLSMIPTRTDRAARARRALAMFRRLAKERPQSRELAATSKDAEEHLKRVLATVAREKEARGSAGAGNGFVAGGLETIAEGEGEDEGENGTVSQKQTKKKEEATKQVGLVAGIMEKVAGLLGLKRRREEDDDGGENERGGRGKIVARFT